MKFLRTLRGELVKLRRSKVTWISFLIYAFMILMAGFMMWMLKNPDAAKGLGLVSQKANLAVGGQSPDWSTFLGLVLEMDGVGGTVFLAFIVAYVFGREYVEGTAKVMFTLPLPRSHFVLAKFAVSGLWFALLSLWLVPLAYAMGRLVGLGGVDALLFWRTAAKMMMATLLAFSACPLVAWVAVKTRGYFAPLGYAIFTLVIASVLGHTGWALWCPWSIIGLYTGAAGTVPILGPGSYLVLAATFALGLGLTLLHELRADNVQ